MTNSKNNYIETSNLFTDDLVYLCQPYYAIL